MKTPFEATQFKTGEIIVLSAVSLMGLLANLPESVGGSMVDRKVVLATLIAVVVIALCRYLQVLLLTAIVVLAIGANLPGEMAEALGISQLALMADLGVIVVITLANRTLRLLPIGNEFLERSGAGETFVPEFASLVPNAETANEFMLTAISKGDIAALRLLLAMKASVNYSLHGTTPLHLAAEKGYSNIIELLLEHGADPHAVNAEGKTPLEVALTKKKFARTTELLFNVTKFLPTHAA